jgi:hypothetical protein
MSVGRLRVAIVGGGIGGLAAANALSQRGIDVRVYEQAEQLAEVGAGVAIQPNGVRILRRLGLGAAVESRGSRWTDSQYCRLDGTVVAPMLPSSHGPIDYFGMYRPDLLDMLLTNLPGDVVRTGHRCIDFEQATSTPPWSSLRARASPPTSWSARTESTPPCSPTSPRQPSRFTRGRRPTAASSRPRASPGLRERPDCGWGRASTSSSTRYAPTSSST